MLLGVPQVVCHPKSRLSQIMGAVGNIGVYLVDGRYIVMTGDARERSSTQFSKYVPQIIAI